MAGRFWLERLIKGLTYVSAMDQASSAVKTTISVLHFTPDYLTIIPSLEDLLFHRIGKEWEDRNSISSLLEQYELSVILGNLFLHHLRISICHLLIQHR